MRRSRQTAASFAKRYVKAYKSADLSTAQHIRHQAEAKLNDAALGRFYDIINEPQNMEIAPEREKSQRPLRHNPGPSAIPARWTPATVSRKGGQIQIRMGGR
jgi:hypothetical protein